MASDGARNRQASYQVNPGWAVLEGMNTDETLWSFLGAEIELYQAFPLPSKCPSLDDAVALDAYAMKVAGMIERSIAKSAMTVRPSKKVS